MLSTKKLIAEQKLKSWKKENNQFLKHQIDFTAIIEPQHPQFRYVIVQKSFFMNLRKLRLKLLRMQLRAFEPQILYKNKHIQSEHKFRRSKKV